MVILHRVVKVNNKTSNLHYVQVLVLAKCPNITLANGHCIPSCQGSVGDSITINCYDGYNLTGSNIMKCTENDTSVQWDIVTPQCLGKHHWFTSIVV